MDRALPIAWSRLSSRHTLWLIPGVRVFVQLPLVWPSRDTGELDLSSDLSSRGCVSTACLMALSPGRLSRCCFTVSFHLLVWHLNGFIRHGIYFVGIWETGHASTG